MDRPSALSPQSQLNVLAPSARADGPSGAALRDGCRARIHDRRQHLLDLVAQVLERGREDEVLAQLLRVLVRGEPRSERRDLEEDAGGLAEVDGAEPEAVDDRRWGGARAPPA